jgi:hypothetical protein
MGRAWKRPAEGVVCFLGVKTGAAWHRVGVFADFRAPRGKRGLPDLRKLWRKSFSPKPCAVSLVVVAVLIDWTVSRLPGSEKC